MTGPFSLGLYRRTRNAAVQLGLPIVGISLAPLAVLGLWTLASRPLPVSGVAALMQGVAIIAGGFGFASAIRWLWERHVTWWSDVVLLTAALFLLGRDKSWFAAALLGYAAGCIIADAIRTRRERLNAHGGRPRAAA